MGKVSFVDGRPLAALNDRITRTLELTEIVEKDLKDISGGERQRLAIGQTLSQKADVYVFDEPTSFLDIKQRITVAKAIHELAIADSESAPYIILAEHDLSILDHLSDTITILYGKPGAYGAVTKPQSTYAGINQYLKGYLTTENLRFRDHSISFAVRDPELCASTDSMRSFTVPAGNVVVDGFALTFPEISFMTSAVTVIVGENGIGKSTYLRDVAGHLKDCNFAYSYKPQHVSFANVNDTTTVEDILVRRGLLQMEAFKSQVIKPLSLVKILKLPVKSLSGGEMRR